MTDTGRKEPCAVCGTPTAIFRHDFFEGTCQESWRLRHPDIPWRPARQWSVEGALYFRGDKNFCGAPCASAAQEGAP